MPDLIYASFREGALLGEADFFAQSGGWDLSRRCFTAKAQGPVELLVLTKSSLLALAEDFRPDVGRLFAGSQTRLQSLLTLKRKAAKLFASLLQEAKGHESVEHPYPQPFRFEQQS